VIFSGAVVRRVFSFGLSISSATASFIRTAESTLNPVLSNIALRLAISFIFKSTARFLIESITPSGAKSRQSKS